MLTTSPISIDTMKNSLLPIFFLQDFIVTRQIFPKGIGQIKMAALNSKMVAELNIAMLQGQQTSVNTTALRY